MRPKRIIVFVTRKKIFIVGYREASKGLAMCGINDLVILDLVIQRKIIERISLYTRKQSTQGALRSLLLFCVYNDNY